MNFIMCSITRNDKMRKTIMKLQKHHRSDLPQKKSGFKVFMNDVESLEGERILYGSALNDVTIL